MIRYRPFGFIAAFLLTVLAGQLYLFAQWEVPDRSFHKAAIFALEGRHLTVPCASCHLKGQMKGTPTTCYGCHWIRRRDDRYQTRLGTQCEHCHRPSSWSATLWNHAGATGVALNPAHQALGCEGCHKGARFDTGTIPCASCHQRDYDTAKPLDHRASGFSLACDSCHFPSDTVWTQGRFPHNAYYPLVGVHGTLACASCHVNGVYIGTGTSCFSCHKTSYARTTSPNHASAGFGTACDQCHKATDPSWLVATFSHNAVYPLVGVHATVGCATCHVNGVYAGTSTTCIGCHRTQYIQTLNPNHAAAGFGTACDQCHRATDPTWRGATFNHNAVFALVGVHATVGCTACHLNSVYPGTPTDCYSCHRTLYNQTTNPKHASAGFPTTCDVCHKATDATWAQGKFSHTWFPITSGHHAGNACSACHINASNYVVFTCTTCHGRTQTDSHHRGVSGYAYDSNRCYACHPTGKAGGLPGSRP